jgi:C1A family cysteine protease
MKPSNFFFFVAVIFLFLLLVVFVSKKSHEQIYKIKSAPQPTDEYLDEIVKEYVVSNGNSEDPDEQEKRKQIVKQNLQKIYQYNQEETKKKEKNVVAKFTANKFLAYTYEEIVQNFTGLAIPQHLIQADPVPAFENYQLVDFDQIPSTDAKKDIFYGLSPKLFNKARDQGICGSCWAFSAVTAVEAQIVKKYVAENPAYIAVQYYIDCVKKAKGCEGGFPLYVYEKIAEDGFVMWDKYTPYSEDKNEICAKPKYNLPIDLKGIICFGKEDVAYFTKPYIKESENFYNLDLRVPNAMMKEKIKKILFNYGPISLLIYVDHKLPYISSGIFIAGNKKDGKEMYPNHAVVVAGYGMNIYGEDYWIVRNSWGSEWAEDGYVQLSTKSHISGLNLPILEKEPPLITE